MFLASCNGDGEQEQITVGDVEDVYKLYVNGDYEEYVNNMYSCRTKPESYKQAMVAFHRQHAEEQAACGKQVRSFSVERVTMHNEGHMAQVYLHVCYADSTEEEILFPMVQADGNWWAQ